jgi:hypothetical protein
MYLKMTIHTKKINRLQNTYEKKIHDASYE